MKTILCFVAAALALAGSSFAQAPRHAGRTLEVFEGSVADAAVAELARRFEKDTGARVLIHAGGSGAVLAQMELARRGDVFLSGSSDFMELAKRKKLVDPATETRLAYLIPALQVAPGNPKGISKLEDLARPGVRVGIGRPETVCAGLYGVEMLEAAGLGEAVKPNVAAYGESCSAVARMLSLELVDAVFGWTVFQNWDPKHIRVVPLPPEAVGRIGYVPAAVSVYAREPELAREFLAFLRTDEAQEVFRAGGFLTDLDAARRLAAPGAPVGGEYSLPDRWK